MIFTFCLQAGPGQNVDKPKNPQKPVSQSQRQNAPVKHLRTPLTTLNINDFQSSSQDTSEGQRKPLGT